MPLADTTRQQKQVTIPKKKQWGAWGLQLTERERNSDRELYSTGIYGVFGIF